MKLLHIDSSVLGDASVSRRLSADIVARLQAEHPDLTLVRRDLAATPLPHITGAYVAATRGPGAQEPPPAALAEDFAALDEFLAADVVVIGAPMYNFGIASNLKAWLDRLALPGKTFSYVDGAPKGLCGGKRIIVASSRGGVYTEGPYVPFDHQENVSERPVRLPRHRRSRLRAGAGPLEGTGGPRRGDGVGQRRDRRARRLRRAAAQAAISSAGRPSTRAPTSTSTAMTSGTSASAA